MIKHPYMLLLILICSLTNAQQSNNDLSFIKSRYATYNSDDSQVFIKGNYFVHQYVVPLAGLPKTQEQKFDLSKVKDVYTQKIENKGK